MAIKVGTKNLVKIGIGPSNIIAKIYVGASENPIWNAGGSPIPDISTTLSANSWETIRAVCEAGTASSYWAIGDVKPDTGVDNISRIFRICDMSGLYNKHVVFEEVGVEGTSGTQWEADNVNNYSTSDMRVTVLPTLVNNLSSELSAQLTNTTLQVVTGGNDGTLLTVTDKLFLPAEREIFGTRTYGRTEEYDITSQYQLYAENNTNSFRVKYDVNNTARAWWLRSPFSGYTNYVLSVDSDGSIYSYLPYYSNRRYSPCFAW